MLFNSLKYALFLPIVFLIYWLILGRTRRGQNLFLLLASYFFYACWDWKFLFLIFFTSFCSWLSGLLIESKRDRAKIIVAANVVINIGILFLFKYYDFFLTALAEWFPTLCADRLLLHLILPVGISFYTFQALSYTIDVYRKKIAPTRDIVEFLAFVSFFPQLVAGPIERATNLLPQFQTSRSFSSSQALDGVRQILWGLFKKMVIADRCGWYVDAVWGNLSQASTSSLWMAAFLFAIQIYGDFSGYSDCAIGSAKLFGFQLRRNFNVPYFSRDIAEFWRRWHISLTTWFRDYIYIPLGGSRVPKGKILRNTLIIFLVSGLWHGANWTFILWGLYHAFLFLPLILLGKNRKNKDIVALHRTLPTLCESLQILATFFLCVLGWILFRADNLHNAFFFFRNLLPNEASWHPDFPLLTLILIAFCTLIEWIARRQEHGLSLQNLVPHWLRILLYYGIVASLILFSGTTTNFIYFQF